MCGQVQGRLPRVVGVVGPGARPQQQLGPRQVPEHRTEEEGRAPLLVGRLQLALPGGQQAPHLRPVAPQGTQVQRGKKGPHRSRLHLPRQVTGVDINRTLARLSGLTEEDTRMWFQCPRIYSRLWAVCFLQCCTRATARADSNYGGQGAKAMPGLRSMP